MKQNKKELKTYEYATPPKPTLENVKEIKPDTADFAEPEKAEAVMRFLNLDVGSKIKENSQGEYYEINPRMELQGTSPEEYERTIRNFKALLLPREIRAITEAMKRKTKGYDEKLYHRIEKTLQKRCKIELKRKTTSDIKTAFEKITKETHGIANTLYHLLSKGKDDFLVCYREAWFNRIVPDDRKWEERNDGEYRVLTDSEADQAFVDYLDEDSWRQAVEAKNTTSSFAEWTEEVKDNDGRGSSLNSYDGSEDVETVNGTTYYIYRTN